jgi:hypothetical protein
MDSRMILAEAIVFATIVGGWMSTYETLPSGSAHRNRWTGVVCDIADHCWLKSW